MPKPTLEQDLDKGIATAQRITDWNTRYINGEVNSGEDGYATAPGCGTKAALLALLPLGATLAAWIGGWPC